LRRPFKRSGKLPICPFISKDKKEKIRRRRKDPTRSSHTARYFPQKKAAFFLLERKGSICLLSNSSKTNPPLSRTAIKPKRSLNSETPLAGSEVNRIKYRQNSRKKATRIDWTRLTRPIFFHVKKIISLSIIPSRLRQFLVFPASSGFT